MSFDRRLRIAVVGAGVSGLSAAWLLCKRHHVTLFEEAGRLGGHANTVVVAMDGRETPVDTGFIVFNRKTYPNFSALLDLLEVRTAPSDMSFGVSLNDGAFEYSGSGLGGLFGQIGNACRPRFWLMLADLLRFYRQAAGDPAIGENSGMTLADYLRLRRYGRPFCDDHLLPMASAIWSAPVSQILSYPAAAFIRFHENHGLLQLRNRPKWETVVRGSRVYVDRVAASLHGHVRLGAGVREIRRGRRGARVRDAQGREETYDYAVIATRADQALRLLAEPTDQERSLLGAFGYSRNVAALHCDQSFMPRRRRIWSSWNHVSFGDRAPRSCVTYWMNRLQPIETDRPLFVTLNPPRPPRPGTLLHEDIYHHPVFDQKAIRAQKELWRLQGRGGVWFCGAYFGSGFHEDGIQSGLAAAERLGGVRRPWSVPDESGRIALAPDPRLEQAPELAS